MSDMLVLETRTEYELQKDYILDLQNRLADAESKIMKGEKLRKKMHNTVLELKGNIRLFCRARPFLYDDIPPEAKVSISFPISWNHWGEDDLNQIGQKHSLSFDKFSCLIPLKKTRSLKYHSLYKVPWMVTSQTGSGKTHTMMRKPGISNQKGLIRRTLKQVYETRQSLQAQGWKYDKQPIDQSVEYDY